MEKGIIELILAVAISISGAVGYMHGVFASKSEVEGLSSSVSKVEKLLCTMAINEHVKDAVKICTGN